jgi:hypothetical protein
VDTKYVASQITQESENIHLFEEKTGNLIDPNHKAEMHNQMNN